MAVNKELIKQRKAMYGDNFECIAQAWSQSLIDLNKTTDFQPKLNSSNIAYMMAKMKQCRIDAIDKKMIVSSPPSVTLKLLEARKDSVTDKENYEWIANNFEEYQRL